VWWVLVVVWCGKVWWSVWLVSSLVGWVVDVGRLWVAVVVLVVLDVGWVCITVVGWWVGCSGWALGRVVLRVLWLVVSWLALSRV
jgi:hypothetical protein